MMNTAAFSTFIQLHDTISNELVFINSHHDLPGTSNDLHTNYKHFGQVIKLLRCVLVYLSLEGMLMRKGRCRGNKKQWERVVIERWKKGWLLWRGGEGEKQRKLGRLDKGDKLKRESETRGTVVKENEQGMEITWYKRRGRTIKEKGTWIVKDR